MRYKSSDCLLDSLSACDGRILCWQAVKVAGWCLLNGFIYYGREGADWMRIKVAAHQAVSRSPHCLSSFPTVRIPSLSLSIPKSITHFSLAPEFIGRIYWLACVKRQKTHASKYLISSSAWASRNWFILSVSLVWSKLQVKTLWFFRRRGHGWNQCYDLK